MKLIICGGRYYALTQYDIGVLDGIHFALDVKEVVSGACAGADKGGERWAKDRGIPIKQFLPNWDDNGSAAGPIRNQLMADYADACIAFKGGNGTQDMIKRATNKELKVWDLT